MHGWISIPGIWQLALLALAPVVGLAVGAWSARSKYQIALWFGYTLTYSVLVVLLAFLYESHRFRGQYNLAAWSMLVIPVFVYALPAVGLPWLLARKFVRSGSSQEREGDAEKHSAPGIALFAISAVMLVTIAMVAARNMPVPVPQSTYVIPPIDPAKAPEDLAEVTNGSDWSCTLLREGKPTSSLIDYHFDALNAGARWQSFSHRGELRPFFDLDHANGGEQFFSGAYSAAGRKLQLASDYAGMPLSSTHQFAKGDQEAMRARHDPRLRGEIVVQPNGCKGTLESVSFRSLSSAAMSLTVEFNGDVPRTAELACRRIHDSDFRPIAVPSA